MFIAQGIYAESTREVVCAKSQNEKKKESESE